MDEPAQGDVEAATAPVPDATALIASLRTAGAARFDAVRFHYIEALAARASAHGGSVRRMLDLKLTQALLKFQQGFEQARGEAGALMQSAATQHPQAAKALQLQFEAGDFTTLRRLVASLDAGRKAQEPEVSLAALVQRLEQHAQANPDTSAREIGKAGSRAELKTLRHFRNTWSKLSTGKQVARALAQAPANAGPINSHMLVLRSLALMRDISPDYLNRFISYADTLLCLDQAERDRPAGPKKPPAAKAPKK